MKAQGSSWRRSLGVATLATAAVSRRPEGVGCQLAGVGDGQESVFWAAVNPGRNGMFTEGKNSC